MRYRAKMCMPNLVLIGAAVCDILDGRTDGRKGGLQTDRRTDGRTDERKEARKEGRKEGRKGRRTNICRFLKTDTATNTLTFVKGHCRYILTTYLYIGPLSVSVIIIKLE